MSRRAVVLGSLALLVVALTVLLVVRWLDDGPRERLEAILSEALDRDVSIGRLDIDVAAERVELHDVVVANPDGVQGAPLLQLRRLTFEVSLRQLLDRRIVGEAHASGAQLRVVRFAEGTNLDGMLPTAKQRPERPPPELHLDIRLDDGRITLEDLERAQTLLLSGMLIEGVASNRDSTPHMQARLGIEAVELGDVRLRGVELVAHASAYGVKIPSLQAEVGEHGRLSGSGDLHLRRDNMWSFGLEATGVAIDEDITPLVQRLFPVVVAATGMSDAPVRGFADANLQVAGQGLAWETIRPTLVGSGTLTVRELVVPPDAMLVSLASLAGRPPQPWSVDEARVTFALGSGWVTLASVESGEAELELPITGGASFEGELDLRVELMPLVKAFGGGVYEDVARYTTSIPVRIGGTVDQPALRPPTAADVARGLGGGLLRRGLDMGSRP